MAAGSAVDKQGLAEVLSISTPAPLHPSIVPGQCERVRGLEAHVMYVSWVPWG